MDGKGMREKVARARRVVEEAVSGPDVALALYRWDLASRVLLHLLKEAGGGRVPVRVTGLRSPSLPGEALRFADKLRRMYSLDMTYGKAPYAEEGAREDEAVLARRGSDAVKVLSPCTEPFEDGGHSSDAGGFREYRPLSGFTEEELWGYVVGRRLPVCSLDAGSAGGAGAADAGGDHEDPDEKQLAEKLKSLGYM